MKQAAEIEVVELDEAMERWVCELHRSRQVIKKCPCRSDLVKLKGSLIVCADCDTPLEARG